MEFNFTPIPAVFCKKLNRFVGEVVLQGEKVLVHIPNSGRLAEILTEGRLVYLREGKNPGRKYQYDLVLAQMPESLVLVDSLLPNKIAQGLLEKGIIKPFSREIDQVAAEQTKGQSRFDFKVQLRDKTGFIEVKSVTLVEGKYALFPDAPTPRGVRHLEELRALSSQYLTAVVFLICREDAEVFKPNDKCDPYFASALKKAAMAGVYIKAYRLKLDLKGVYFDREMEVVL
ncbi:DNA/RNA nuclease SfsA [Carboxydothermus hydrogenoformans]|uniref:Sugar fermentation stimulation protein homolog n=1 Tax=Carboxydothermus hydrogenoformans (strain ATCC BAA-161 / DSM 6008 / Z-2901) TaxID=246194 RepID=SFSA_CARHZ|nr:DNA/RNA nuclease SfsA [Carboxydothermus hydrogenoformans]Q3AAC8.1 RecName: Full=Sugar fermentation stimulation protein homolog [Carboxydothermus hydrogenoformans Z-2901]ABB15020.1 sugar fermentation stimulation protein [Carboxydothermus hydrogenoformans Z-2901]